MSWMHRLYQTYDVASGLTRLPLEQQIAPIGHTLQNAHIRIVIDGEGNFRRTEVLKKTQILLPATEASENRTSGEAPHPLADKLQYVARDYPDYGGQKKAYSDGYIQQLADWCASAHSHPKAQAILSYVQKGRVIADLVASGILPLTETGNFLTQWTETTRESPEIFAVLPKDKGHIEPGSALIAWTVESAQDHSVSTDSWKDPELQKSWMQYLASQSGVEGFCMVKGQIEPIAAMHPAKLRHTGDKAKLISSNDEVGLTFKGRFLESDQAASISTEVSQKAHAALRWLISRQSYKSGDMVTLAWAASAIPIQQPISALDPTLEPEDELWVDEEGFEQLGETSLTTLEPLLAQTGSDHSADLGESYARKLRLRLSGYKQQLQPTDQITIISLDSATPGRMALTYYREMMPAEYFNALEQWYEQFCWFQRVSGTTNGDQKKGRVTVNWPVISPTPLAIAQAAYDKSTLTDALKKQVLNRLLPCIVGGGGTSADASQTTAPLYPFPVDIVQRCIQRACNPFGGEQWEWERNIGVACAVFKGYYARHPDPVQRRNYSVALDESNTSRDYLYGRLLAIAENIESYALFIAEEKRVTNAERLFQQFPTQPLRTWEQLEKSLQPYLNRLNAKSDKLRAFAMSRKTEIDRLVDLLGQQFNSNERLTGEFLLGYHSQRIAYRLKNQMVESNPELQETPQTMKTTHTNQTPDAEGIAP